MRQIIGNRGSIAVFFILLILLPVVASYANDQETSQIEKLVEVLRASFYTNDDVIFQEIALYKVPTKALADGSNVEEMIRANNARILTVETNYIIIEKTGHKEETQALFEKLVPYGILQFVRSGRIAVTKQIKELTQIRPIGFVRKY